MPSKIIKQEKVKKKTKHQLERIVNDNMHQYNLEICKFMHPPLNETFTGLKLISLTAKYAAKIVKEINS